MFLFPVSCDDFCSPRAGKYGSAIIYITRSISERIKWKINWNKVRDVVRKKSNIGYCSDEYFALLRNMIKPYSFYCDTLESVKNIGFCLFACRFKHKKKCDFYLKGKSFCLDCKKYIYTKQCGKFNNCRKKLYNLSLISIYFSDSLKRIKMIQHLNYGNKYKTNYNGKGSQLYLHVGKYVGDVRTYCKVKDRKASTKRQRKFLNSRKLKRERIRDKTRSETKDEQRLVQ